jgi:transposase
VSFVLQPWQILLVSLAGWINREQRQVIEYLITENQILKEKIGKKRILLNDDQRRRLAVKGKVLGRKMLGQIATIVTPDTILRWHRQLVAKKWDYSDRCSKPGRPRVSPEIVRLTLRIARQNLGWGYDKIQGALENLGLFIGPTTVSKILKAHGVEPAPDRVRRTTWRSFLKAHWDCLGSIDFTTIEVWTSKGLVTYYLLFVMEVASRRIHFAGCSVNPKSDWMCQIARNLTDPFDGFLLDTRLLLMDRDGVFCPKFRQMLDSEGIRCLRLPAHSPNLTPHIERFMRTIKEECLHKMVFFGERSLRKAVKEFCFHYHEERNHQGLENKIIQPGPEVGSATGKVRCRKRLGGMLKYYYREAA